MKIIISLVSAHQVSALVQMGMIQPHIPYIIHNDNNGWKKSLNVPVNDGHA